MFLLENSSSVVAKSALYYIIYFSITVDYSEILMHMIIKTQAMSVLQALPVHQPI